MPESPADKAMFADSKTRLPLNGITVLDLTRVHNTGAAFGMLNGVDFPFKTLALSLVAIVALIIAFFCWPR